MLLVKPDNTSPLPLNIERVMLEILTRPRSRFSEREDSTQREGALRALFTVLDARHAQDLFRRLDAGDDPLAEELRRFVRRRRR